jgi:hypothetical protein
MFWDVYVGILGSINDARVLRMSSSYHRTIEQNLFVVELGQEGIRPCILKDKGYPLLLWLMVPHKQTRVH